MLQDADLSCFVYVEQLTLLLFLKMADQRTEPPYNRATIVPPDLGWKALVGAQASRSNISNTAPWSTLSGLSSISCSRMAARRR